MTGKYKIDIKLLPDGRVCIHWLIKDENGPVKTQGRTAMTAHGPFQLGGFQGRIACNPLQNTVNPQIRNGVRYMCHYVTELQSATCPKCLASDDATVIHSDQVLEGLSKIGEKSMAVAG